MPSKNSRVVAPEFTVDSRVQAESDRQFSSFRGWCSCFGMGRQPSERSLQDMRQVKVQDGDSFEQASSDSPVSPASFVPKSVLIIDDSRVTRKLLKKQFEEKYTGLLISTAASSEEADVFLDNEGYKNFDLITFDYDLGLGARESGVGVFSRHIKRAYEEAKVVCVFPRFVFNTSSFSECLAELESKGFSVCKSAVYKKTGAVTDVVNLVERSLSVEVLPIVCLSGLVGGDGATYQGEDVTERGDFSSGAQSSSLSYRL